MSKQPDLGVAKATREERKTERLKAWKRETKKADRQKAREERIAAWEEATGHSYEEVTHGRADLPGGTARSGR